MPNKSKIRDHRFTKRWLDAGATRCNRVVLYCIICDLPVTTVPDHPMFDTWRGLHQKGTCPNIEVLPRALYDKISELPREEADKVLSCYYSALYLRRLADPAIDAVELHTIRTGINSAEKAYNLFDKIGLDSDAEEMLNLRALLRERYKRMLQTNREIRIRVAQLGSQAEAPREV